MTDNEKKMLNSISPFENSMMCAMIAGDTLEKIRGIHAVWQKIQEEENV